MGDAHYLWSKIGNGYSNLRRFSQAAQAYKEALDFATQISNAEEAVYREAISMCLVATATAQTGDTKLAEKLLFEDELELLKKQAKN